MAQAIADRNISRHGFLPKAENYNDNHIGRITGISSTKENNVLLCDNQKNKLVLLDTDGTYLNHLNVDSSPWDVAISVKSNIAFVTLPNESAVLTVDPDRLLILSKILFTGFPDLKITSVSPSIVKTHDVYLGVWNKLTYSSFFLTSHHTIYQDVAKLKEVQQSIFEMTKLVVKHNEHFCCVAGSNHIFKNTPAPMCQNHIEIPGIRSPIDICSDDYGHIYVCGQYSNDIHRLNTNGSVIDMPFSEQHGLKNPVAMAFNSDFSRFYIVTDFGKCVRIYDVI